MAISLFTLGERPTLHLALALLVAVAGVLCGSLLGHRPGARAAAAARVPVLPSEEP